MVRELIPPLHKMRIFRSTRRCYTGDAIAEAMTGIEPGRHLIRISKTQRDPFLQLADVEDRLY